VTPEVEEQSPQLATHAMHVKLFVKAYPYLHEVVIPDA